MGVLATHHHHNHVSARFMYSSLRIAVFVGGVVSLALEMSAPRLLAPYFGTSLFIWANVIGLFADLSLGLGYFIGGRIADRHPEPRLLCTLTAIAALAAGLIPFISKPVLDWSVRACRPSTPASSTARCWR